MKATIKDALDGLPEAYDETLYKKVVEVVYEHVFESYWGEGKSKSAEAASGAPEETRTRS